MTLPMWPGRTLRGNLPLPWWLIDPGALGFYVFLILLPASLLFCLVYLPARRMTRFSEAGVVRLMAPASVILGVIGVAAYFVLNPIRQNIAEGGIRANDTGFATLDWLTNYLGAVAASLGVVAAALGIRSSRRRLAIIGLALSCLGLPLSYLFFVLNHSE